MDDIKQTIASIPDKTPVKVGIPVQDSAEKTRFRCIYLASESPVFCLFFPADALPPVDLINQHQKCGVMIDLDGKCIYIAADIQAIIDKQTIQLTACEIINHEQSREYFRIDVTTPVIAASIVPREFDPEGSGWKILGETIDVSGNGMQAAFYRSIDLNKRVHINLILPTPDQYIVNAIAQVVRIKKIKTNCYHIAFHFEKISSSDRDRIVACCFDIQRKHLRLKVQIKDNL